MAGHRDPARVQERTTARPRRRQTDVAQRRHDGRVGRIADIDHHKRVTHAPVRTRLRVSQTPLSRDIDVGARDNHPVRPEQQVRIVHRPHDRRRRRNTDIENRQTVAGTVIVTARSVRLVAILADHIRIIPRNSDRRPVQQRSCIRALPNNVRRRRIRDVSNSQRARIKRRRVGITARNRHIRRTRKTRRIRDRTAQHRPRRRRRTSSTPQEHTHHNKQPRHHRPKHMPARRGQTMLSPTHPEPSRYAARPLPSYRSSQSQV